LDGEGGEGGGVSAEGVGTETRFDISIDLGDWLEEIELSEAEGAVVEITDEGFNGKTFELIRLFGKEI